MKLQAYEISKKEIIIKIMGAIIRLSHIYGPYVQNAD